MVSNLKSYIVGSTCELRNVIMRKATNFSQYAIQELLVYNEINGLNRLQRFEPQRFA